MLNNYTNIKKIKNEIDLKLSKSNHVVPIYNGINTNCLIDPLDEAFHIFKKYESKIAKYTPILVIGLGFAYNLNHLIKKIKDKGYRNNIYVLAEDKRLIEICLKKELIIDYDKLNIISRNDFQKMKSSFKFQAFLRSNPLIYNSTNAFETCNDQYFELFEIIKSNETIKQVATYVNDLDLKKYLENLTDDIENHINNLKNKTNNRSMNKYDYLLNLLT